MLDLGLSYEQIARPPILRLIRQMIWLQLLSGSMGDRYEEEGKHYEI